MDLDRVMDDLAGKLRTLEGLGGRVFEYPPGEVTATPAGIVTYPDKIDFDQTYGRGMDILRGVEVLIIVGEPTKKSTRKQIAGYVAGDGPRSVKAALESKPRHAFDDLQVIDADFDVVKIAGVDYLAAIFRMDIAGRGSI